MRLKALLRSDADEVLDSLARPYVDFWMGVTRKHPVGKPVFDLLVCVAAVVLVWVFVGPTAGAVALAITLGLYGWGVGRVVRQRRCRSN